MSADLRVGQPAPDFTLPSTGGGTVTLSALRGVSNVLLAFFPLAFTSTCTTELCAFSSDFPKFTDADARVFGLSVDSMPTLKEFRSKYDITVDLLSDFKREASRKYGVLLDDKFFSARAYFLIDRQGVLRWQFVEAELGNRRENAELLAEIAKIG
ncbi:MAG TPA: redoxin domain-containing protein [Gemmatimonadales bacterium]|jgi:peroxiredoxin